MSKTYYPVPARTSCFIPGLKLFSQKSRTPLIYGKKDKIPGWRCYYWQLLNIGCLAFGTTLLGINHASAQLIPDTTLRTENSVVTPNVEIKGLPSDRIDDGAIRGVNLFHSFKDFNVGQGRGVYFSNPAAIERIITRVTGSNTSQILGTLGVLGNADLFLINPNGIVFGSNAQLDVNASFISSSASSIIFNNGIEFSATNPTAPPLLTINVPLGLQYGSNSGSIVNRAIAKDPLGYPAPFGLFVPAGHTLALVGGDINFEGGFATVVAGRIELVSVGDNNFVSLTPTSLGWSLGYEGVQNFRDVNISQGGAVQSIQFDEEERQKSTASGEGIGDVVVQARRLTLTDASQIFTGTFSSKNAGNLVVRASDSIELIGVNPDDLSKISGLFNQTFSSGNAGNLSLETGRLIVRDGAAISTNTFGEGSAGDLIVNASKSVELIGTNPNPSYAGGISANVETKAKGDGGNLTINTGQLMIQGGAEISVTTFGTGKAGNLTINASESVDLIGTRPEADPKLGRSGLFASSKRPGTGDGGDLNVNTGRLTVSDGASISTATSTGGDGGNLNLNVRQLIVSDGGEITAASSHPQSLNPSKLISGNGGIFTINATDFVEITGSSTRLGPKLASTLNTSSNSAGNAGNLFINTGELRVNNEGEITVSSTGSGSAGNLDVTAGTVKLDNQGKLTADSTAGQGNINLKAKDAVIVLNQSKISTNSTGTEPGGNITINTDNLVGFKNSNITANAINSQGGQITVSTQGFFISPDSSITATSALGSQFNGVVQINSPDIDPTSGLVELPQGIVDSEQLIAQDLCKSAAAAQSSFNIIGRGGLPPNPDELLTDESALIDWAQVNPSNTVSLKVQPDFPKPIRANHHVIQQANGWVVNADGRITLVANAPQVTLNSSAYTHPDCHPSTLRRN